MLLFLHLNYSRLSKIMGKSIVYPLVLIVAFSGTMMAQSNRVISIHYTKSYNQTILLLYNIKNVKIAIKCSTVISDSPQQGIVERLSLFLLHN